MGNPQLIASFQDTLARCGQGLLEPLTAQAVSSSRVYPEDFRSSRLYAMQDPQIGVVQVTSFAGAKALVQVGKTAVLNFANPHFPGGGVKNGATAQEECLCRSSNLYPCLAAEQVVEEFYRYHREKTDYFFSDRLIYTRDVTVFKSDEPLPGLLPQEQWFQVDVITCAAPYLAKRKYTNQAALGETFRSRIRNILEAAIDNEVEVLVLGAFGCGAFQNPPQVVAHAFRQVLQEPRYGKAFRKILFAIRANHPQEQENLRVFTDVFSGRVKAPNWEERDITMPGGRVLRGKDSLRYQQWRQENPLFGKQFSILGDSISTLEGYNPPGYRVFYQGEILQRSGVGAMEDTWWGKVITFFGGELLVNNAWSGSLVTPEEGQGDAFPSGCSSRRTGDLHIGAVTPDVILVHLGINDWIAGVDLSEFGKAYRVMLESLQKNYPSAEIWCATLSDAYQASNPEFVLPSACAGAEMPAYNRAIGEIAWQMQCKVLDFDGFGVPYDSIDGTHPTAAGMDTLAVLAIRAADPQGGAFLDCEGGNHHNIERTGENGDFRYVCRRCGNVYVLPAEKRKEEQPLLQLHQKDTGKTLRFQGERILVGRSMDCSLRLNSGYAARYQATFLYKEGDWYVRDNNSLNGTFHNGTRMSPGMEAKLQAGDEISFAKQETVIFRPIGM